MPDVDPVAETRAAWARLTELANPRHTLGRQSGGNVSSRDSAAAASGATTPNLMTETSAVAPWEEFSAEQRWHFNTYGQLGVDLLHAASAGQGEAAYRLGVVMTIDRHPRKARNWLAAASQMSHAGAAQLLASDPGSGQGQALAAEHAYRLGHTAHHGLGDRDQAVFYYKHAAKHGHSDAAYHLAHLFLGRGENGTAARWFSIAGQGENLDAKRQLWKLGKNHTKGAHCEN
ncbi:hypothetical protein AB0O34_26080 [Sphaerisporangium sp. NPDC088356]|uniref:hypothetical protein n=1 Tax=Sphaerisporangium sp. NPDC088356 TaxID=3154871 RepID=UPI00341927EE